MLSARSVVEADVGRDALTLEHDLLARLEDERAFLTRGVGVNHVPPLGHQMTEGHVDRLAPLRHAEVVLSGLEHADRRFPAVLAGEPETLNLATLVDVVFDGHWPFSFTVRGVMMLSTNTCSGFADNIRLRTEPLDTGHTI